MTRPDPLAAQEAREPRGQTVEPVAKPLEWRDFTFSGSGHWIADHAFGSWDIRAESDSNWPWVVRPFINGQSNWETLEEAKTAAEAEHTRLIRSALVAPLASPDRVAELEEALRQSIAREWLASYDDCHRPDYAFADQMMRDRGKHAGDCPHVDQPAPMTCCGCLVDDAFAFADRALSSTRSET